jgi:hypothetical protein
VLHQRLCNCEIDCLEMYMKPIVEMCKSIHGLYEETGRHRRKGLNGVLTVRYGHLLLEKEQGLGKAVLWSSLVMEVEHVFFSSLGGLVYKTQLSRYRLKESNSPREDFPGCHTILCLLHFSGVPLLPFPINRVQRQRCLTTPEELGAN